MMNNKELLTEEAVNNIDAMLRRLASMKIKNGHLKMEFEDVVSELWINVLKTIERTGNTDLNYLASASFHKMVDLTRYNVLREATPYDNETMNRILPEELRNSKLYTDKSNDTYVFSTTKPEKVEEKAELLDILNLFEKDSKEYKFVYAWMRILGIIEDEARAIYEDEVETNEPETDEMGNIVGEYGERFLYVNKELKKIVKMKANAISNMVKHQGIEVSPFYVENELFQMLKCYGYTGER